MAGMYENITQTPEYGLTPTQAVASSSPLEGLEGILGLGDQLLKFGKSSRAKAQKDRSTQALSDFTKGMVDLSAAVDQGSIKSDASFQISAKWVSRAIDAGGDPKEIFSVYNSLIGGRAKENLEKGGEQERIDRGRLKTYNENYGYNIQYGTPEAAQAIFLQEAEDAYSHSLGVTVKALEKLKLEGDVQDKQHSRDVKELEAKVIKGAKNIAEDVYYQLGSKWSVIVSDSSGRPSPEAVGGFIEEATSMIRREKMKMGYRTGGMNMKSDIDDIFKPLEEIIEQIGSADAAQAKRLSERFDLLANSASLAFVSQGNSGDVLLLQSLQKVLPNTDVAGLLGNEITKKFLSIGPEGVDLDTEDVTEAIGLLNRVYDAFGEDTFKVQPSKGGEEDPNGLTEADKQILLDRLPKAYASALKKIGLDDITNVSYKNLSELMKNEKLLQKVLDDGLLTERRINSIVEAHTDYMSNDVIPYIDSKILSKYSQGDVDYREAVKAGFVDGKISFSIDKTKYAELIKDKSRGPSYTMGELFTKGKPAFKRTAGEYHAQQINKLVGELNSKIAGKLDVSLSVFAFGAHTTDKSVGWEFLRPEIEQNFKIKTSDKPSLPKDSDFGIKEDGTLDLGGVEKVVGEKQENSREDFVTKEKEGVPETPYQSTFNPSPEDAGSSKAVKSFYDKKDKMESGLDPYDPKQQKVIQKAKDGVNKSKDTFKDMSKFVPSEDRELFLDIAAHEGMPERGLFVPFLDGSQVDIGFGHKLVGGTVKDDPNTAPFVDKNGMLNMTEKDIVELTLKDIEWAKSSAKRLVPGFDRLDKVRKDAVVNMVYNLGEGKFSDFKQTFKSISEGDWQAAAYHMRDSEWYHQVGYRRAEYLVEMMVTGRRP